VNPQPTLDTAATSTFTPPLLAGVDENLIFRTLFAANPDAHLVADGSGTIVLVDPAACTMFGYATDELVGLNVDALVPDSIRPRHAPYRAGYAHQPRSRPMGTGMELVAKRRDGSVVMVEISLSPLVGQGPALVVAAIRGVADYPRVKQALQRARYGEHLVQLGRLAVDVRDTQVVLAEVTVIAAQALQVESSFVYFIEPDNQHFRVASRVHEATHEAPHEAASSVQAELAEQSLGGLIRNQPNSLPGYLLAHGHAVMVTDYPTELRFQVPAKLLSEAGASALAVLLTDRGKIIGALTVASKQAKRFGDDELRFLESLCNLLATSLQRSQSEEAFSHAQRLESVGQLTGGIAHDFNNLLTVIQGNLQVLEELPEMGGHEWGQHLIASALRATQRGAELTGKLLAFSRRQMLQPRQVNLAVLLESLADMLRPTVDQRIRISVDVSTDCPAVLVDPGQLESALLNLAINARDAMPEGGTLRFAAQSWEHLPSQVKHELAGTVGAPGAPDQRYVSVRVTDSGSGMPDAVKERAFEPFFTIEVAAVADTFLQAMPVWCESVLRRASLAHAGGMRGIQLAALAAALHPRLAVLLTSGFSSELIDADRESPLSWALLPQPYTRQDLTSAVALALGQVPKTEIAP
jgi:PAS domain S-box-containing protein